MSSFDENCGIVRVVESRHMKRSKNAVRNLLAAGLALILIVAGIWIVSFESRAREPVRLATSTARCSTEVRHVIGEPVNVGRFTRGSFLTSKGGNGNADLTIHIYGPSVEEPLWNGHRKTRANGIFAPSCSVRMMFCPASRLSVTLLPTAIASKRVVARPGLSGQIESQ